MGTRTTKKATKRTTKRTTKARTKKPEAGRAGEHARAVDLARYEAKIRAGLARGESIAWEVGMAFDTIGRLGLHEAAGFTSLEAYADARFPQGYTTLKRYRRVALAFRRETVVKYGVTKLALGLLYIDLTPENERPAEIPRLAIRVPDAHGKNVALVPFAKATSKELERAVTFAKARPGAHDDLAEAHAKRARFALQAAVAAPKGSHAHAPLVRAHALAGRGLRYDVVGIDAGDLERVAKAMLAHAKVHVATPAAKSDGGKRAKKRVA